MSNEPLIQVENLSKKFCSELKRSLWYGIKDLSAEVLARDVPRETLRRDEFWAVKDLSFRLMPGKTLGLIGPNGAGKTTLLRILTGLLKPDLGRVTIRGRLQALIALGAGFNPILTGRENIYINASVLGITKAEVDERLDEIVEFADLMDFIDSPVKNYSSGMTVRLGFAVAAHLKPDVLLVDEVLAVGDEGFQAKCLNKIGELKATGSALILVSHNMHTISTYSDQILFKTRDSHQLFDNVAEGVQSYKDLFSTHVGEKIDKNVTGTESFSILTVDAPDQDIAPGENFCISIEYSSEEAIPDIEIDTVIRSSSEGAAHFQATNRAFSKRIDIQRGRGTLKIAALDIRLNSTTGSISFAIWKKGRTELLFWWRFHIKFLGAPLSTGSCHYNMTYMINNAE